MKSPSSPTELQRRADAEMALAIIREDLNRALAYRIRYDTEGHNVCLAIVDFLDGSRVVLAAYSNDAALPESIRLGLNLVPNIYELLPVGARFGCDGMAQYHTEPKLLNFICASPDLRQRAFQTSKRPTPRGVSHEFFLNFVDKQRRAARDAATRLNTPENISALTLVSEIDCCRTCVSYSIQRFRTMFPGKALDTIELGKAAGEPTPYQTVRITRSP
jgi:hypothetical protein